jgi:hypothetical protein
MAQPANFAFIRAVPVPCASQPGDIVGLLLEGGGSPAGTVVVFGQAFRAGDLPQGASLSARLVSGQAVPAQADVTTRHPDGSALFAVVSLAAPALRPGERAGVVLSRAGTPSAAPSLDPLQALPGRAAMVEITPDAGGTPFRADLLALFRTALERRTRHALWQQGSLAVQARVGLNLPPEALSGAAAARLVADVALRADGTLWVDVWVRNDIAMRPSGGAARYALRVVLDGREALASGRVEQFQYTGWGRLLGAAPGGRVAPSPPLVRADTDYLAEAAALARYDRSTGVEEDRLAGMAQEMASPEWAKPLGARGLIPDMGRGGNRADIGPITLWQAAWVVSGDRRAAEFVQGQAEADGAIPWHFWDPEGGADGSGGWIDTKRFPQFWVDQRGGRPPRTLTQPIPPEAGWGPDRAHQPELSFVPYLLTGRRAFLDGLLSQGAWGVISQWPAARAEATGLPAARDLNIIHMSQVRSAAWSMRTLDNAAWIAPDEHPNAPWLRHVSAVNWAWLRVQIPRWTASQGEAHGWLDTENVLGAAGQASPWQHDFFTLAAAIAARRGNADARAFLTWMTNFVVGRFQAEAKGFNPRDGIAYVVAFASPGRDGRLYRSWAEIGAQTVARNQSNGTGWQQSEGYYGRLGLSSLAVTADALGSEAALAAYRWLLAAAPPFTQTWVYARDPTLNVIPKGHPRVPDRAQGCATPGRGA